MQEAKSLLTGVFIACALLIGMAAFAGDIFSTYSVNQSKNISFFKAANQAENYLNQSTLALQKTDITGSDLDAPLLIVKGAYSALKLVLGLPTVFINLISGVAGTMAEIGLPIPAWTIGLATVLVSLVVVFSVLKAIFKV